MQVRDEETYQEVIQDLIEHAPIAVKAVLGKSQIALSDFIGLMPGDIIRIDRGVDQELDIYVGNMRKFTALPGSSGQNYAVRVTSVIREEE